MPSSAVCAYRAAILSCVVSALVAAPSGPSRAEDPAGSAGSEAAASPAAGADGSADAAAPADSAAPAAPSEPRPAAASSSGRLSPEGGAAPFGEEEPPSRFETGAAIAVDAVVLRPLSACATIIGFGSFIASVPLVAPFGRMEAIRGSWEYFVLGPYDYTVVRPFGDF